MKLSQVFAQMLLEGITFDNENNSLVFDVTAASDNLATDAFIFNRRAEHAKGYNTKLGIPRVPIYYSIRPNPNSNLTDDQITAAYSSLKRASTLSDDMLYRIILVTVPEIAKLRVKYILPLYSSSPFNKRLVSVLQKKYRVPDQNVLPEASKLEYYIDDMINKDAYEKASAFNKKAADTWISRQKKAHPGNPRIVIKKSPDPATGHPGLQSGMRDMLNPVYQITSDLPDDGIILVVDDFMVGGTSIKEVMHLLIQAGVSPKNIAAYCFGAKREMEIKPKKE